MKYIYATLLLYEVGKEINEENLKRIFKAIGEEPDIGAIRSLLTALKSVNIKQILESVAPTALMPSLTITPQAPVAVEEKKVKVEEEKKEKEEKKKEEEKIEETLEGLSALFG
ncbi:MAG: 50S ribosomal protein P1 [Candidatus Geothermarchaeota archaeon]